MQSDDEFERDNEDLEPRDTDDDTLSQEGK